MANQTQNYRLATDVAVDELIEPWHHNRLADTVDQTLGGMISYLLGNGAHTGWEIDVTGKVSAGCGLVGACWCKTTAAQAITGLTSGAVNYVTAELTETSAPQGEVAFVARLSATAPANAVGLGTVTVAADGTITGVANDAGNANRQRHGLCFATIKGTATLAEVPANGEATAVIEHGLEANFRLPGELTISSSATGFTWRGEETYRGDGFCIVVQNHNTSAQAFTMSWERTGIVRD